MDWQEVSSSNVAAIAYDPDASELYVRFHSGAEYVYLAVPASVYDGFMEAPSKGRYLNDAIKGKYEYNKL